MDKGPATRPDNLGPIHRTHVVEEDWAVEV